MRLNSRCGYLGVCVCVCVCVFVSRIHICTYVCMCVCVCTVGYIVSVSLTKACISSAQKAGDAVSCTVCAILVLLLFPCT